MINRINQPTQPFSVTTVTCRCDRLVPHSYIAASVVSPGRRINLQGARHGQGTRKGWTTDNNRQEKYQCRHEWISRQKSWPPICSSLETCQRIRLRQVPANASRRAKLKAGELFPLMPQPLRGGGDSVRWDYAILSRLKDDALWTKITVM